MVKNTSRLRRVALILVIAVAVHLDWHLGRPEHIRHSLGWEHHWLLGLILGACIACFVTWRRERGLLLQFMGITGLGFVGGQILEPVLEAVIYDDVTLPMVYPAVRWILFMEFAAAFVVGGAICSGFQSKLRTPVHVPGA